MRGKSEETKVYLLGDFEPHFSQNKKEENILICEVVLMEQAVNQVVGISAELDAEQTAWGKVRIAVSSSVGVRVRGRSEGYEGDVQALVHAANQVVYFTADLINAHEHAKVARQKQAAFQPFPSVTQTGGLAENTRGQGVKAHVKKSHKRNDGILGGSVKPIGKTLFSLI